MVTKGNLFTSRTSNFRCHFFVYSLRDGLAKIILRSCVTRDGAICIKNVRFEYFDENNPTGKGVSYNLLQRLWVLFVSYCCLYASLVGYSYGLVCIRDWTSVVFYSWTLAINRKKLTTLLVQIERRRSHVEAAQFCWRAATCKNELVSVSSWHKWFMK